MMYYVDLISSDYIIASVLFLLVLFLFIGLSFLNPFNNKRLNVWYRALMYIICFSSLMIPQFFYLGFASEFKKIGIGKTSICLFEEYDQGGGETQLEHVCRLHVVDKATGDRKGRYYIGKSAEMVGMQNDTVCYISDNKVIVFDTNNLREIYTVKKDGWETFSNEFSVGMENISRNGDNNTFKPLIILYCKNGKKYWFDPFAKKVFNTEPANSYLPQFSDNGDELCIPYDANKRICYLKSEYAKDGRLKKIVSTGYSKKLFTGSDNTAYIEPFLMSIDPVKKIFVLGYHRTTDLTDFFIEAKDFNFKTLWKKTAEDFEATDRYNTSKVNVWKYNNDVLYFNCGGFIIAMDPYNGKVIWKTRL